MGWFSKTKKKKEQKKEKKKVEPLFDCPVCGKRTFEKATEYVYDEKYSVGDIPIIEIKEKDCRKYTGDETGFCKECGGIVHGWIFADPKNAVNAFLIKEFNLMFLQVLIRMSEAKKSGGDSIKTLHKTIEEIKDATKDRKIEFNVGYYILIMLLENKIITFQKEVLSNYNTLKMGRSLLSGMDESVREAYKKMNNGNPGPHESVKQFLKKCCPEFF